MQETYQWNLSKYFILMNASEVNELQFFSGQVHINTMGNPRPDHWLSPGLVIKAQVQQNVVRPNDETVSGEVLRQNSGLV